MTEGPLLYRSAFYFFYFSFLTQLVFGALHLLILKNIEKQKFMPFEYNFKTQPSIR